MLKIKKNNLPNKHTFNDFKCSGPIAEKDGDFYNTKIADLGCFKQEEKDNNKYYSVCICCSKLDNNYYVYTEHGRTGERYGGFQFILCSSEDDAKKQYIKLCESKNIKRGIWKQHKTLGKVLEPKPNKDLYLVRQLNSRQLQLIDANNISNAKPVGTVSKNNDNLDSQTINLFNDLGAATDSFTRSNMVGSILPSQKSINEVRLLLDECTKITNKTKEYKDNKELKELSQLIYGRIPKKKARGTSWIITPDKNIEWQKDLDCFESALSSNIYQSNNSSLSALNLEKFKWVDSNSKYGYWVKDWWESATRGKHSYISKLKVKNLWYMERIEEYDTFNKYQKSLGICSNKEKPLHQIKRKDKIDHILYNNSQTFALFHGSRSVNISSIIKYGLRLPKTISGVSINGAYMGSGLYFADDHAKSAGYCSIKNGYWSRGSGAINNRGAFMFICDAALGKIHIPKRGKGFTSPPNGYNSVMGKMNHTGHLQNNEYVLYNTDAVKLRYLIEFE